MKIGIDVDGVLRDFQTILLSRIRKSYPHYIETEFDEIPSWKMEDCFNVLLKRNYNKFIEMIIVMKLWVMEASIKENVDFLRDKLNSKRDYSIVCVTSQKPHVRHFTLKWLGNQQLNFDEVYFKKGRQKWKVHAVDWLVDDSLLTMKLGLKIKKDWNYILLDTIYNRGINPMYRVKNLKDLGSKMEL